MGKLFTLSDSIKTIAGNAIDDLINQLGKQCRLIFPPIPEPCSCGTDPIGNKPGDSWTSGAAVPGYEMTNCPLCNGTGYRESEFSKTITVLIAWTPVEWFVKLPNSLQYPEGTIQTKGFMTDLPDVLQSRKMVIELSVEPIVRYTFDMASEPIDSGNIIQGRYFVALWKRVGS